MFLSVFFPYSSCIIWLVITYLIDVSLIYVYLNNKQVQGKDRLIVKFIAQQLGMEGSYIARTYIEQIQLEKIVDEVMVWQLLIFLYPAHVSILYLTIPQALPDDLKTKLSLDEDMVSSPKEALSKAFADRVPVRNTYMRRWNFPYLSLFICFLRAKNAIDNGLKIDSCSCNLICMYLYNIHGSPYVTMFGN